MELGFDFHFLQIKDSLDNPLHSAWTGGDKRSSKNATGAGPKLYSSRDGIQDFDNFWFSLKSIASAWCISASDN